MRPELDTNEQHLLVRGTRCDATSTKLLEFGWASRVPAGPGMANYHLTISVRGRRALARDEAERRVLVRAVTTHSAGCLILFCLVDDHFHAVLRSERVGYLASGIHRTLQARRRDLKLEPVHLVEVDTRAYLRWLVPYLLKQPEKHGLGVALALWTGSCFQDLVGARLLPGFSAGPLRDEEPRMRQSDLLRIVGLSVAPLVPADDEALARAGAARLVELAAGVHGVGPVLSGRAAPTVRARALAARVAHDVGVTVTQLARFLGIGERAVRYLLERDVDEREVLALRRRLALEERAAQRRSAEPRSSA